MNISKRSLTLLDAFDVAAQDHGYQKGAGFGSAAINAEKDHTETRLALARRIARLEESRRQLQVEVGRLQYQIFGGGSAS